MKGLKGKVALVTGAAGGMGRQICKRLIEEGCRVAAIDVDSKSLEAMDDALHREAVDIGKYGAVCAAVAATEA
jgi:2-hydroxycyclohexanecarboxyl-CoA dehydrogenase